MVCTVPARTTTASRRGRRDSTIALTSLVAAISMLAALGGCATVDKTPEAKSLPADRDQQLEAQKAATATPAEKVYKRRIAIGRFSNESNYGRGLLVDEDLDPLGKQASDVLATQLEKTQRFIVFERPDLSKILAEQEIAGTGSLVGVDALILGSVTEFGRATEGTTGFLSSTKRQRVNAKVNLRLVDPTNGRVIFGADGAGEAVSESGEVAGFGSRAAYDSTLNERAISAAISDVIEELVTELEKRRWRTYILDVQKGSVFISGGQGQGIRVGDTLSVVAPGKTIVSKQSGLPIELPGSEVARIRVETQFGADEASEGSVCSVVSGSVSPVGFEQLVVEEPES